VDYNSLKIVMESLKIYGITPCSSVEIDNLDENTDYYISVIEQNMKKRNVIFYPLVEIKTLKKGDDKIERNKETVEFDADLIIKEDEISIELKNRK
jgi:hypothetical protein